MPIGTSPPPAHNARNGELQAFVQWLVTGAAGVALLFVIAEQVPQRLKLFVFFPLAVENLAAWGLGRWGARFSIRSGRLFLVSSGLVIAGASLLVAIKTHREGVRTMLSQKYWQQPLDPVSANFKEFVQAEPEDETPEARKQRLAVLAAIERGEAMHKEQRDYLTFYGYLANRIPKAWGKWSHPWPAVFWIGEVLVGSSLGAWVALWTLRSAYPRDGGSAPATGPDHRLQDLRR
jgi:hypothetical protein